MRPISSPRDSASSDRCIGGFALCRHVASGLQPGLCLQASLDGLIALTQGCNRPFLQWAFYPIDGASAALTHSDTSLCLHPAGTMLSPALLCVYTCIRIRTVVVQNTSGPTPALLEHQLLEGDSCGCRQHLGSCAPAMLWLSCHMCCTSCWMCAKARQFELAHGSERSMVIMFVGIAYISRHIKQALTLQIQWSPAFPS